MAPNNRTDVNAPARTLNGIDVCPLKRRDVVPLRDALAKATVAKTTRRFFPRSLPAMLDWYDHIIASRIAWPFAIFHKSAFIGYCSLREPIFSGRELAIAIFDTRYNGKGVGTLAVTKLCTFGFLRLRLQRIELAVYPSNRRALACYAQCGFRQEALLRKFLYHEGEWQDTVLMSLLRQEWEDLRNGSR
jgi:RimJ/RimL family protein N-acetyltransferase